MNVKELFSQCNKNEVSKIINQKVLEMYGSPVDEKTAKKNFNKITDIVNSTLSIFNKIEPIPHQDKTLCYLSSYKLDHSNEQDYVFMIKEKDISISDAADEKYDKNSIMFDFWEDILGYTASSVALIENGLNKIAAEFLWEILIFGIERDKVKPSYSYADFRKTLDEAFPSN